METDNESLRWTKGDKVAVWSDRGVNKEMNTVLGLKGQVNIYLEHSYLGAYPRTWLELGTKDSRALLITDRCTQCAPEPPYACILDLDFIITMATCNVYHLIVHGPTNIMQREKASYSKAYSRRRT